MPHENPEKPVRTVHDLKSWEQNPRKISASEQRILFKTLESYGDLSGIVFNRRSGTLVGGHQRHAWFGDSTPISIEIRYETPTPKGTVAEGFIEYAGERFKYREVDWDEPTHAAAALAANRAGGDWDWGLLKEVMTGPLAGMEDWEETGWDANEVEDLLGIDVSAHKRKLQDKEDKIPDIKKNEMNVQLGDIFQLGDHRLICGDSTDPATLAALLFDGKADIFFTDPPYNVNYESSSTGQSIANDDMKSEDFYAFLRKAFDAAFKFTLPGAPAYVCHADAERVNFTKAFEDAGFYLSSVIIWVKNSGTFGRQDYFWRHEPLLYGWNSGGGHPWFGPNNEDTVWNFDKPRNNDLHPTMKPVDLVERALKNSSSMGHIVLDSFGGSGTTIIAAEKLKLRGRICELDPHYCSVILKRWEDYAMKKAYKIV